MKNKGIGSIRQLGRIGVFVAVVGYGPIAGAAEGGQPNTEVLERLNRVERAMNRLGLTIEELELELRAARVANQSGESSGPGAGLTPINRDCESARVTERRRRAFPGRTFSTW